MCQLFRHTFLNSGKRGDPWYSFQFKSGSQELLVTDFIPHHCGWRLSCPLSSKWLFFRSFACTLVYHCILQILFSGHRPLKYSVYSDQTSPTELGFLASIGFKLWIIGVSGCSAVLWVALSSSSSHHTPLNKPLRLASAWCRRGMLNPLWRGKGKGEHEIRSERQV